jgi:hypothetical protein
VKKVILFVFLLLFTACGGGESVVTNIADDNSTLIDENANESTDSSDVTSTESTDFVVSSDGEDKLYVVAKDNSYHDVNRTFKEYDVVVYSNRVLDEQVSNSTKAIYGKINAESTTSLLAVNSNYSDGDEFIVRVYLNGNKVGESQAFILNGTVLDFGSITVVEEGE